MKLTNTRIDIENQYTTTQSYSRKETISLENTSYPNSPSAKHRTESFPGSRQDELKISVTAITTLQQEQVQTVKSVNTKTSESEFSDEDNLKIEILRNLLRLISGKDYDLYALQAQSSPEIAVDKLRSLINQAQVSIKNSQSPLKQAFGLAMLIIEAHREDEQLTVNIQGSGLVISKEI